MIKTDNKRIALTGTLVAVAFLFSYLESLLPVFFGIPGIKPGLANLVVLVSLYLLGTKRALMISVIRLLLSAFTFGSLSMLLYSLAGGITSFAVMAALKKVKSFSMIGVSVAGGIVHNLAQLAVAYILVGGAILYYAPMLIMAGIGAGLLVGIVGSLIYGRLRKLGSDLP